MEKEVLNLILVEIREMKGDMSEVKSRLSGLEQGMTEVKGRLTKVESDMSEMKTDITEVKGRLTNLENDMSEMKTDITEVKERLTNVENDMSEVKKRLKKVEELSEFNQETCQSIKNVVTSHYMEFKKHIKANSTQHNLYNAKLLQYKKEK